MSLEAQRQVNLILELTQHLTTKPKKASFFNVSRPTLDSWLKGGKISEKGLEVIAAKKGWTLPQLQSYLETGSIELDGSRLSLEHIENAIASGSYTIDNSSEVLLLGRVARAALERQTAKLDTSNNAIDTTSLAETIALRVDDWDSFYAFYPSTDEEERDIVRRIVAGKPTLQRDVEDVRSAIFYTIGLLEAASEESSIVLDSQVKLSRK